MGPKRLGYPAVPKSGKEVVWYTRSRMPDQEIVAYYDSIAKRILPFLRGRRVAVRHLFDHTPVFRRHPTPLLSKLRRTSPTSRHGWPEPRWIYVPDKKTLLEIVRQHGYEFFPHLEGKDNLWFALDIDVRAVPLALGKKVVRETTGILDERRVRYLLTFSGGNGFHIRWAFRRHSLPEQKWQFLRDIIRSLQEETEERLQASAQRRAFYKHIPRGDPITELNSMDLRAQHSVLFDALIVRPEATIRAPFSLHTKHRWVAVPVAPRRLAAFLPRTDATMATAMRARSVRLPLNPVTLFTKRPWTR